MYFIVYRSGFKSVGFGPVGKGAPIYSSGPQNSDNSAAFYVHVTVHRNKFLYIKTNSRTNFPKFIFVKKLYMFRGSSSAHHQEFSTVHLALVYVMHVWWQLSSTTRTNFPNLFLSRNYMFRAVPLPIIRSFPLCIWHWYMSYRFDDSFQARHALISQIYFCQETLHVSGSSSAHHQEFSTVHLALVYVMQVWWQLSSTTRTNFPNLFLSRNYMFRAVSLPIIRSFPLYIWHWHMSCRFDDSFRARPSWTCLKAVIKLSLWKWVPGTSPGVKAGGAFGWQPTTLLSAKMSRWSGALIYPEPLGPPRPVAGDLFFINYKICLSKVGEERTSKDVYSL